MKIISVVVLITFLILGFKIISWYLNKPQALGHEIKTENITEGVIYYENYSIPPPGCKDTTIIIAKLKSGEQRGYLDVGCEGKNNRDFSVTDSDFKKLIDEANKLVPAVPINSDLPPLVGGYQKALVFYKDGKEITILYSRQESQNEEDVIKEVVNLLPYKYRLLVW